MHGSVLGFLRGCLADEEVAGESVLEVGSGDVNGSPRTVLIPMGPRSYMGVDFAPGKGVDRVMDACRLDFPDEEFDIVVSTEALEHIENWKGAIVEMKRVLAVGGLLIVTTRGPGFPHHGYPHDHWRFAVSDFYRIFMDMQVDVLGQDPEAPGVFMRAEKRPNAGLFLGPIEVAKAPRDPAAESAGHD